MALAKLSPDGNRIHLETNWTEKDQAAQVPGMNWSSSLKCWHGPLSWGTCLVLRGIFQERLALSPELNEWAQGQRRLWIDQAMYLREVANVAVDGPGALEWYEDINRSLYTPQQAGVVFLGIPSGGMLLGDEMGCGKTPQVLAALEAMPDTLPALVICPNSVKGHWAQEAATWAPSAVPYLVGNSASKRRKVLEEAVEDPNALVIMNFEAVRLHSRLAPYGSVRLQRCTECKGIATEGRCEVHLKELNNFEFKTVIVDEAHRIKDPKSKQTRATWWVMHQESVTRRIAMTGTPIANDVSDLWSIMHAVAKDDYPTRSEFIDRYGLLAWNHYGTLDIVGVRPDTKPEFEKILHPRFRRMLKAVVLPYLPKKVRQVREAEMVPKQAKAYRQVEDEFIAELEDGAGTVLVGNNLTKALRLVQFSSSYCEVDEETGGVLLCEPSPKLDVLEEIIDEMGEGRQLAVCAASRQLIEMAAARFDDPTKQKILKRRVNYRLLTGTVPPPHRVINLNEFQAGQAQVMLFTIAAGGVGVNMTAADTIVFLQRSWSMLENRQAEDRVHRVGSERHESIQIIDIVAPDTIEVRQIRKLTEKANRLEEIVNDRAQLAAAGRSTVEIDNEEQRLLSGHLL